MRWLKLARIAKLGKGEQVANILMDFLLISPRQGKTIKVLAVLVCLIHLLSCSWWLWKVLAADVVEVEAFLDAQPWGTSADDNEAWVRPPLESVAGKVGAYIISVYVVTMTLTTVGYGDINAENSAERVGYVLFFIAGAFIWGKLLAELGDLHRAASAKKLMKMEHVMETLDFLVEHDCPRCHKKRALKRALPNTRETN